MLFLSAMKNLKKQLYYGLLAFSAMLTVGFVSPVVSQVGAKCSGPESSTFSFPAWYKGLPGTCKEPEIRELNDIWIVVMNFIEILLQVAAYVAAGFVLWGGFKYIKSEGEPAKIAESKSAIMSAVIGLVIALGSVAIVQFVQGGLIR